MRKKVVILGAGLTGMSAAYILKDKAVVVEKSSRPGGLVKTDNHNGYWFDHVLHLLHFQDKEILANRVKPIIGDVLQPIHPEAWVETLEGSSRYPLQMHLSGLNQEAIINTLKDLAIEAFRVEKRQANNFEEMLSFSFGKYFCELFMFPYNRKVWKRPLSELAPSGFQWNIDTPDYVQVLRGALSDHQDFKPYNSNGWYPRPPKSSPYKGMELLSMALADKLNDLQLNTEVIEVDLDNKTVTVKREITTEEIQFTDYCLSTVPLPTLVRCTKNLPQELQSAAQRLQSNRVISVMLSIEGPRPENRGHWRYYSDPDLSFNRLVYMHNFDPHTAPATGWGLMTEITEPSEIPIRSNEEIKNTTIADINKANALPEGCKVIDVNIKVISPAYVVFTETSKQAVAKLKAYYLSKGVVILGRYGNWEYSSMAQVMNDGFTWAEGILATSK